MKPAGVFTIAVSCEQRDDGFFVAHGTMVHPPKQLDGSKDSREAANVECESRDRDRAVSYALSELAARLGR